MPAFRYYIYDSRGVLFDTVFTQREAVKALTTSQPLQKVTSITLGSKYEGKITEQEAIDLVNSVIGGIQDATMPLKLDPGLNLAHGLNDTKFDHFRDATEKVKLRRKIDDGNIRLKPGNLEEGIK